MISTKEALKRLQALEIQPAPTPEELLDADNHEHTHEDLAPAVQNLQNHVSGLTNALEAIIDILKAFDLFDKEVFDIAFKNVLEYNNSPVENNKLLDIRSRALKKKLADYARSKEASEEAPQAEKPKPGKKVKKNG